MREFPITSPGTGLWCAQFKTTFFASRWGGMYVIFAKPYHYSTNCVGAFFATWDAAKSRPRDLGELGFTRLVKES